MKCNEKGCVSDKEKFRSTLCIVILAVANQRWDLLSPQFKISVSKKVVKSLAHNRLLILFAWNRSEFVKIRNSEFKWEIPKAAAALRLWRFQFSHGYTIQGRTKVEN